MSDPDLKQPRLEPEYYRALDGFRGLLALFVAVYHTIWLSHPNTWAFFNNGPVIIDLFFALSGFLMWRLYSERLNSRAAIGTFMKRRFARLYPLHFFMLLVFVGFAGVRVLAHKVGLAELTPGEILPFEAGAADGWWALVQHVTLTQGIGMSDSLNFNPPSWTIGVEFWTYAVFAAIIMWRKPSRKYHFIAIGMIVGAIYFGLSRVKPDMNITYDYGFWRCLAGFFTGVLAAANFDKFRMGLNEFSGAAVTFFEVLMMLASTAFVIYASGSAQFWVGPVIFAFILVFGCDAGTVSKFMSQRVFRYLAKISYSVYLTHVIISIVFAVFIERLTGKLPSGLEGDAWLVLYLMVVIAVSHFTQRFVEVPGGKIIRNWRAPQKRVAKTGSSV